MCQTFRLLSNSPKSGINGLIGKTDSSLNERLLPLFGRETSMEFRVQVFDILFVFVKVVRLFSNRSSRILSGA